MFFEPKGEPKQNTQETFGGAAGACGFVGIMELVWFMGLTGFMGLVGLAGPLQHVRLAGQLCMR